LKVFNKSEVRSEVWYSQKTSILILITVWSRRDLSIKLKIRLYYAFIVPIAVYASEHAWTILEEDERKLLVF